MKTKEYLGQYIKAKRYAEQCFERLDEIDVSPRSPKLDGMPKASVESDLADTVAKITEIRKKAEDARRKMLDLMDEISDVIEAVQDIDERMLLRLRYIYGLKWENVANEMGYSVQHIYRIHGRALISASMFVKRRDHESI